MKRISFGLIVAIAAIFAASQAGVTSAAGPCLVPSASYLTIQSAVNDPVCNLINVAPGIYAENVSIPRGLTLNGARAGIDARTRSGSESIINGGVAAAITVTADGVTVDGFTLNGPADSGSAAIVMQTGNTGEMIQNIIINNPGRAASFTTSNTVFRRNAVNNTATSSDGFQGNSTPVQNVTISDNNFGGADPNNYNADITIIEGNSNIVVSGNKSTGDGTLVALFKTNGAQVVGNAIVGGGGSSAIYIGGANSNVTVSGNQVGSAGAAVKIANAFGDGINSSVAVTHNTLDNNAYGINVAANSVSDTVVAHKNSLAGETAFGIFNDPTSGGSVNGTCNWWGAATGPGPVATGSGSNVSTGVTYQPWLTTSNVDGPCLGGAVATNKDDCKNGGWMTLTRANGTSFKNQGDCVSYTNNGK